MGRLGAQSLMVPPVAVLPWRSLAALFGLLLVTACTAQEGGPPGSEAAAANAETRRQLAQAHRQLGLGLEAAGDIDGAVAEFETALAIGRWRVSDASGGIENTPYGDLTRICGRGAPAQMVIRTCTRAITSFRYSQAQLADLLANRGDAYLFLSDLGRAQTDFNTVLDLNNNNPRGLFGRGKLKARAGTHSFAVVDFSRAIGGGLDTPETRYARALSLTAIGEFESAIEDYDQVLSDPDGITAYPDAYRHRALAHCQTGQPEAAAIGWQVWLDATPGGGAEVRQMLVATGYLDQPEASDSGPVDVTALRAWIGAGCPEAVEG